MKPVYYLSFVMLLFSAACSGGPAPVEFTVELTEFAFTPNQFEVQVGQEVTFHLVNAGALEHEFMVGRSAMIMDGMPSGYEHNFFEGMEPMVMGAGSTEHMDNDDHMDDEDAMDDGEHMDDAGGMEDMDHGFMVMVPKGGEEATLTFTVTEDMVGEWEIGCFTDRGSHYNAGMHGTLVVTP